MSRHCPSVARVLGPGAITLALLTGCAELQPAMRDILEGGGRGNPRPQTVTYECDDDREFAARFSANRREVRIQTDDGETYQLGRTDRGRGGGGSEYSDDDGEVRLTVGGGAVELSIEDEDDFEDCRAET